MAVEIRPALMPADTRLIQQIDTSFETNQIFRLAQDAGRFDLILEDLRRPRRKTFPLDDLGEGRDWQDGWIALDERQAVGFIATAFEVFNRRCAIWHLYVSPTHRRRGVGRRLLDLALERAVDNGATHAWLETSNLNVPGVTAYRSMGFELCGLDTTLYANTQAADEVALFLQRPLAAQSGVEQRGGSDWRRADEGRAYQLGCELREQLPPGRWRTLSEGERRQAIDEAIRLMRERLGNVRATPVLWLDQLQESCCLHYRFKCGAIHVPDAALHEEDPAGLIAGFASEVRHGWQLDVIDGRLRHPPEARVTQTLRTALKSYNPDDKVNYAANLLKVDAEIIQVAVGRGYLGLPFE